MSLSRTGAGVAAVALSGLALFSMQSPASAAAGDCPVGQHYAPKSGCVGNGASVDHRNFAPGSPGRITSAGFRPGSTAELTLHSAPVLLGTYTASGAGVVTADFTLPTSTPVGSHRLELTGVDAQGRAISVSVPITVAARAVSSATSSSSTGASASSSSLPRTGTEIGLMAAAGLALVGTGAGVTVATRRRRVTA